MWEMHFKKPWNLLLDNKWIDISMTLLQYPNDDRTYNWRASVFLLIVQQAISNPFSSDKTSHAISSFPSIKRRMKRQLKNIITQFRTFQNVPTLQSTKAFFNSDKSFAISNRYPTERASNCPVSALQKALPFPQSHIWTITHVQHVSWIVDKLHHLCIQLFTSSAERNQPRFWAQTFSFWQVQGSLQPSFRFLEKS